MEDAAVTKTKQKKKRTFSGDRGWSISAENLGKKTKRLGRGTGRCPSLVRFFLFVFLRLLARDFSSSLNDRQEK